MLARLSPATMLAVRKYAYLLFALPLALPPITMIMAEQWGHADVFAWGTVVFVFGIVPLLDHIIGTDKTNADEQLEVPALNEQLYYRVLTLVCVPAYAALIIWGGSVFVSQGFGLLGAIGWVLSVGLVGGLAITVAHELIHKSEALEQNAGGVLLSMVCYAGFKVEHVRGHHVHVSTPEDASSARFNQSLYQFLPHAYKHNFLNAWKLEATRLKRAGRSPISPRNELIWWYVLSAVLLAGFIFAFGWMGAVFFLGQSFVAMTLLEIVNYLEHYGLHRRKLENGRYERTQPEHSWNSSYFLTNILLFHLQRHSDHHTYARRRYQVLRHFDESPQLPSGYAGMVLLALFPPLWRRVMNPRVKAYYRGEEHQLQ